MVDLCRVFEHVRFDSMRFHIWYLLPKFIRKMTEHDFLSEHRTVFVPNIFQYVQSNPNNVSIYGMLRTWTNHKQREPGAWPTATRWAALRLRLRLTEFRTSRSEKNMPCRSVGNGPTESRVGRYGYGYKLVRPTKIWWLVWNMNFMFPNIGNTKSNWLLIISFRGVENHQPEMDGWILNMSLTQLL